MTRGIERDGEAFRVQWEAWADSEQVVFDREDTEARADVGSTARASDGPQVIT